MQFPERLIALLLFGMAAMAANAASPLEQYVAEAGESKLHALPTWQKLLHYEESGGGAVRSEVLSDDFFLADDGRVNPRAELAATLRAFAEPVGEDPNAHPQCIFRARFLWLRGRLGFEEGAFPAVDCPLYREWTLDNNTRSISLVFATGYLGNPASYYGHTLIKFNGEDSVRYSDLLDVSVNYGAIVPDNENPVSYILKGMFGGYDAGFSHIQYYHHNHNYGELELRDLWEYELDLTDAQVALVTAHSWELLGRKFRYYFFRKNCAYRVAEVLELAEGLEIIPQRRPWTIPQSLVANLAAATIDDRPAVSGVTYLPSRQSRMYRRFRDLTPSGRAAAHRIAKGTGALDDEAFLALPVDERRQVLDVMLDYFQFVAAQDDDANAAESHRRVLAARFAYPATGGEVHEPDRLQPHAGRPPGRLAVGWASNSVRGDGAELHLRPAYYDALDAEAGHVANSALEMLSVVAQVANGSLRLQRLDVFNVESVNAAATGLPGDRGRLWQLRLGAVRQDLVCDNCVVGRFSANIGRSINVGDHLVIGGYVGAAAQTTRGRYGFGFGQLAAFAQAQLRENLRLHVNVESRRHLDSERRYEHRGDATLRLRLSDRLDLRLTYRRDQAEETSLTLGAYW